MYAHMNKIKIKKKINKMHGPNRSKRIMATIGPRKGMNQVLEGSQDFIWSHTCVET
jgi:hypothetical protein